MRKFNNHFRGRNNRFGRRNSNRVRINESKYVKAAVKPEAKEPFQASFSFADLNVDKFLKQNIKAKGYTTPTPIQDQTIQMIMNGKDVLGIANTGTGKTAAFLIPLIQKVLKDRSNKVLIIAPTRELADQINDELYALTKGLRIFSVVCTGGNSMFRQVNNLRRGFSFIVGTPGRLLDLHNRGYIDYYQMNNIVLDEVDRMLDMGFINDIKEIISFLPEERQSLFFSATMDRKVEDIINIILKKGYSKVSVRTGETAQNVEQDVVHYDTVADKYKKLEEILQKNKDQKILVFASTKRSVDQLDRRLYEDGYRVNCIHGDKRQRERTQSIDQFRSGRINILIATDIAARGLDISGISHVINFDEPNNYEDYVHRIGRTGRAEKSGIALTFVRGR